MCKQNVADKREKLGNCPFDCPFPTISLMGLKLRDNRNKHRQFPREFPPGAIVVSRGSYLIFNLWTRQGIRWKDGRYSCIGHRWSFFAMLIKGSREKSCAKLLLRGSVSPYSPNLFVRTEDQGAREKRGCTRNKDKRLCTVLRVSEINKMFRRASSWIKKIHWILLDDESSFSPVALSTFLKLSAAARKRRITNIVEHGEG